MYPSQALTTARHHQVPECNSEAGSPLEGMYPLIFETRTKLNRSHVSRDARLRAAIEQMKAIVLSLEYSKLTFEHSFVENIESLKQSHYGTNMRNRPTPPHLNIS